MDIPIIRLSFNVPIDEANLPCILEFMQRLNVIIAGNSTLNYHLIPVTNKPFIYIPVFQYKRTDFSGDIEEIIRERIKILKQFFKTYDFGKERKAFLWLLREVLKMRKDAHRENHPIFKVENREADIKDYADFDKSLKLEYPRITRTKLADGSYISVLYDPYMKHDYVMLANLSKPFSEMKYQYNTLHLYEHLMTYAWRKTDHLKEVYMNGLTVVNGISNIYAVLDSPEGMIEYMHSYIDFVLKGRDPKFWEQNKEMMRVETMRTISETRLTRSYTTPSRSDPAAYDCHYNPAIFCKWSNDPFDVLLITNVEPKLNIKAINAKILSTKTMKIALPVPTAKHIPVEVFMDKQAIRVIKESPDNIIKDIIEHSWKNVPGKLYGIDNYMTFPKELDIDFNYRLHGLIYMHRYLKNSKPLDDALKNNNITLPFEITKLL